MPAPAPISATTPTAAISPRPKTPSRIRCGLFRLMIDSSSEVFALVSFMGSILLLK
jgi:hypothetical protein